VGVGEGEGEGVRVRVGEGVDRLSFQPIVTTQTPIPSHIFIFGTFVFRHFYFRRYSGDSLNHELDIYSLESFDLFYPTNIISVRRFELLICLFIYCDYRQQNE
jgi:hypothetical protein